VAIVKIVMAQEQERCSACKIRGTRVYLNSGRALGCDPSLGHRLGPIEFCA